VRVISRRVLREFAERHPKAWDSLRNWANAVESAEGWISPADVRRTFNSADFVDKMTVFDVGGNKYRVITFIHYRRRAVYVKHVLTHQEYSKGTWKP
jgi:mRNA interferase HigB